MSLNAEYVEMLIGDGGEELTATVTGGSLGNDTIAWSAAKMGGANVVSVTKNGNTCNIVPVSTGSTTVRALLPNGSYADCLVIVRAAAELKFDVQTIHLTPGYSETVPYTITPENASVNWITQMDSTSSSLGSSVPQYFGLKPSNFLQR